MTPLSLPEAKDFNAIRDIDCFALKPILARDAFIRKFQQNSLIGAMVAAILSQSDVRKNQPEGVVRPALRKYRQFILNDLIAVVRQKPGRPAEQVGGCDMSDNAAMAQGLQLIRIKFLTMLDERLAEIFDLCEDGDVSLENRDTLLQVRSILHKIAGTAGTLGMQDLGQCARDCEMQIDQHVANGTPLVGEIFESIADFAELAEAAMDAPNAA